MKKILLLLLPLLIFSCAKQPKCGDQDVQQLVINTLSEKILENVERSFKSDKTITDDPNYKLMQPLLQNHKKYIKEIELKLYNFRTTEVNKDIKKCNCDAELSVIDKSHKDMSNLPDVLGDYELDGFKPTIKYSAQITDENKIFVTIENYEDFAILEKNIYAKVFKDIMVKYLTLQSNAAPESVLDRQIDRPASISTGEAGDDIVMTKAPGNYYQIYASDSNPIYFYKSPNYADRKNAYFTTNESVYVESISGDFGFVRFTNSNNQTSKGWIRLIDLN